MNTYTVGNVEFMPLDEMVYDEEFVSSLGFSKEEIESLQEDNLLWFEGDPDIIKVFDETREPNYIYFDTFTRKNGDKVFFYYGDCYDITIDEMIIDFLNGKGSDLIPIMDANIKEEHDKEKTVFEVWYRGGRGYSYDITNYKQ